MTKATELTCAITNPFSSIFLRGTKVPKVNFDLFSSLQFANGPVLIFKTKTLHIVEGQVPGSTQMEMMTSFQCELSDHLTFKGFPASVLILSSLSFDNASEQHAFQTLRFVASVYWSLLVGYHPRKSSKCFPSVNPSAVRAPTDQLLLGPHC